jgi:putative transposase
VVLTYLDESGFAPTCPVSYSWSKAGERKRVPFENPEGRRLNLLAALDRTGPAPGIYWVTKPKRLIAEEFVRFLLALPVVPVPRVVVLDNGSLHRNSVVNAAMSDLWARRIYLYYLPPYSPELNDIEPAFRHLKHNEMPERSYRTISDLKDAVDHSLTNMEERLIAKSQPQLRLAA